MTNAELKKLIADIQRRQTELDSVEVKTARGGTPKRLYEAISAFANRPGGGIILFGLSESDDLRLSESEIFTSCRRKSRILLHRKWNPL
jgi:ATP-dependent DNA helicase RecG